ncbi:MAG: hypothetical protein WC152_06610 [Candidatus Izemoplasmatales bacterium]
MNIKDFKENLKNSAEFKININAESIDYKTYLPEKQRKPLLNFKYISLITVIAILGLFTYLNYKPITNLTMEINPSLELNLNVFNRVVSVDGLNEEANDMLKEINIKHHKINEAVKIIYSYSEEHGYASNDNIYVLFGVKSNNVDNTEELIDILNEDIINVRSIALPVGDIAYTIEESLGLPNGVSDEQTNDFDSAFSDYKNSLSSESDIQCSEAKKNLITIIYNTHPEQANSEYLTYLYGLSLEELYELYK